MQLNVKEYYKNQKMRLDLDQSGNECIYTQPFEFERLTFQHILLQDHMYRVPSKLAELCPKTYGLAWKKYERNLTNSQENILKL